MIRIWCFFSLALFLSVTAQALFPVAINKNSLERKTKHNQRNLDSILKSTTLTYANSWYYLGVDLDLDDSDGLWVIFISSNETILSDGTCSLFDNFICSSPACTEDTSTLYSENFPFFSSDNSTRLNLFSQTIAIADDAWQLSSSPIYIHNCEHFSQQGSFPEASGQIGLGLSGNAINNFRTSNPIFSIVMKSESSAEIIFGFNTSM